MKRIISIAVFALACATLFAQTPKEIVEKMFAEMDRGNIKGFSMDLNMKMPIVGLVRSHNLVLGDKMKSTVTTSDKTSTSWADATTKWTYDSTSGEIAVENNTPSSSNNQEGKAFEQISDGYDFVLQKETDDAWYILCNKSKSNMNKDDAKKIDLVVSKATYLPVSLKTKSLLFTVSIENYALGVSEESVTFDPAAYPDARIVDKR